MDWLGAALEETGEYPHPESLNTFRSHIAQATIEEALSATGTASLRRRRLPADQVVWLVIGMAMMRNQSIIDFPRAMRPRYTISRPSGDRQRLTG